MCLFSFISRSGLRRMTTEVRPSGWGGGEPRVEHGTNVRGLERRIDSATLT